MKIPVTHYADVSPYDAVQAMKKEIYEKHRYGGIYDDVSFRNGVLYGFRYKEGIIHPDITPLNISQETLDVLKALETLSVYYSKGESA